MIASAGGVLAEFIAGAYFYLYNRSLVQLNYFFDKLTSMQDTMLAIKLCENLPEPNATNSKERLITLLMTPNRFAAPDIRSPASAIDGVSSRAKPRKMQAKLSRG
jgi:hypothetical protein